MSAAPGPVPVLEIGGTHVTAALVDTGAGRVVPGSARRDPLDGQAPAGRIVDAVVRCGARLPAAPGVRWGVAVPGPFDYERGVALFAGVGKFDSLYGLDLGAALAGRLPQRPAGVRFLNDADAFLLGEWRRGAAAGHRRCVGITLGTGVGSAFLADGVPLTEGAGVPPEGRADLLEAGGLPLEEVVSRRAIRAAYARRTGNGPGAAVPDVAGIAERARGGEEAAGAVLGAAFATLGEVLGPWLAAFGADVLVVGGSMTGSWDLVGPALREGLARGGGGAAGPEVRVAALPGEAALLGAAWHAAPGGLP